MNVKVANIVTPVKVVYHVMDATPVKDMKVVLVVTVAKFV
jgi:hypothetical protein